MRVLIASLALLLAALPAQGSCQRPGNVVRNCGFTANATTDWTNPVGTCTHDAVDGSSAPGSASCASSFNGIQHQSTLRQCTPDAVTASYGFGVDTRLISGTTVSCSLNVQDFTDDGCTIAAGNSDFTVITPESGSFVPAPQNTFVTAGGTSSLRIELVCGSSNAFTVHADDFFAGAGFIFFDGLETGGVARWSNSL